MCEFYRLQITPRSPDTVSHHAKTNWIFTRQFKWFSPTYTWRTKKVNPYQALLMCRIVFSLYDLENHKLNRLNIICEPSCVHWIEYLISYVHLYNGWLIDNQIYYLTFDSKFGLVGEFFGTKWVWKLNKWFVSAIVINSHVTNTRLSIMPNVSTLIGRLLNLLPQYIIKDNEINENLFE